MQLQAGQNIPIVGGGAYSLSFEQSGWGLGAILFKNGTTPTFLENQEGATTVDDKLLLNLPDLASDIEKILIYIERKSPACSTQVHFTLKELMTNETLAQVDYSSVGKAEKALNFIEVYKRNGQWKIRCILQGYTQGITKLLESHGMQSSLNATNSSKPNTATSHTPIYNKGEDFTVSLTWGQKSDSIAQSSASTYVGENFNPISDLRVGCFYELSNGQVGMVHSIENGLGGSFDGVPYIKTARSIDRHFEQLHINPMYAHKLYRYLIFVNIVEGFGNWDELNVEVRIEIPGVDTQIFKPNTMMKKSINAVAMIEFNKNGAKATQINEYFHDLLEMDHAFAWGLPWRTQENSNDEE